MPIIESDSLVLALTSIETTISASLTAELRKGGRSRVNTTIVSVVDGSAFISAESDVATIIVSFANGGLAGTPDILGSSTVATTITGSLSQNLRIAGFTRIDTTIAGTLGDQVSEPEIFEALITLDLLMPRPAGGRMYTERLYVDGQLVPVREWQATLKIDGFVDINIELHDPEQRSLITRTSLIKFEIGLANQPFNTFEYKTLIEDGYFNESAYQERADDSDTFTFTGLSAIHKKLNRTSANGLVVYDPNLVDVDVSDFRVVYDDFGRPFVPEIVAIPKLTMEKLFHEIYINRCGFNDVFSNLPVRKWSISRVDFPAGRPYLEAFNSRIGMYFPSYDQIGDDLWIRGTRIPYPAGSPTPETIEASETMDLQLATDHRRVDVIELIFNLFTYEYDYTSQRTANA